MCLQKSKLLKKGAANHDWAYLQIALRLDPVSSSLVLAAHLVHEFHCPLDGSPRPVVSDDVERFLRAVGASPIEDQADLADLL